MQSSWQHTQQDVVAVRAPTAESGKQGRNSSAVGHLSPIGNSSKYNASARNRDRSRSPIKLIVHQMEEQEEEVQWAIVVLVEQLQKAPAHVATAAGCCSNRAASLTGAPDSSLPL